MSTAAAESRSTDADVRDYAAQKRAEKKAAAEEIGVTAGYIDRFV
jgi:hemoglobin